jgi:Ctr copper transporter family
MNAVYLVPPEAIIIPDTDISGTSRTFADMRNDMVLSGASSIKEALQHSPRPSGSRTRARNGVTDIINVDVVGESSVLGVPMGCGTNNDGQSMTNVQEKDEPQKKIEVDDANNNVAKSTYRYQRRRLQMVDDASVCDNSTNFYCWMSCLKIPDSMNAQKYIDGGYSLYCADPAWYDSSNRSVVAATSSCDEVYGTRNITGGAMNEACIGMWLPTSNSSVATPVIVTAKDTQSRANEDKLPYCYGGTSMYMDGFHWRDSVCVIYLFPSWILSSSGIFIAACFGTVFAGIALEGFIRQRRTIVSNLPIGWKRLIVSTICYGMQLALGYLIMLIVMTFSGPLFVSVIIGLMSGHFLFNMNEVIAELKENETSGDDCQNDSSKVVNYVSSKSLPSQQITGIRKETDRRIQDQVTSSCCIPLNDQDDEENCNFENGSELNHAISVATIVSKQKKKMNIVPEGSTPCCQNDL